MSPATERRANIPPIISVDDHIVEPPDLWQRWLPERLRDRGPRVVRSPYEATGKTLSASRTSQPFVMASSGPEADFWIYEDLALPITAGFAAVGLNLDETGLQPLLYDQMRPGCYSLKPRLEDMEAAGIERSLCFPTVPRFCGQTFLEAKDKQVAHACVQAYNDFMVEEWCADSGGRLVPLCIIPLWDAHLAAAEIRRNADRGVRAVSFSELPANLGLPSIHDADRFWDPFLQACEETGTVICIHIGSGSQRVLTSADAPGGVAIALLPVNCQLSLMDWLLSDTLERFPTLKLAFAEAQIGWIPFVLEQADRVWEKSRAVTELPVTKEPPSTRFRGRIYGCFFDDDFGLASRDAIGVDQIVFESDYPHQDSTWPNTRAYAEMSMVGLSDAEIAKIIRSNAIELFGLPERL